MTRGKTAYLHKFAFSELDLDLEQVRLILGQGPENMDEPIPEMIRDVLRLAEKCCFIEGGYVIYDDPRFDVEPYRMHVGGVALSIGKVILPQIIRSTRVAVFVGTAGEEIGKFHATAMAHGNFLYASIVDGVSTLIVERAIDMVQHHLVRSLRDKHVRITNRFSPGFCNWDSIEQKPLFSLLPPGFSKVSINHTNELVPAKSIAGIIGIGRDVRINEERCEQCTTPRCVLRKS